MQKCQEGPNSMQAYVQHANSLLRAAFLGCNVLRFKLKDVCQQSITEYYMDKYVAGLTSKTALVEGQKINTSNSFSWRSIG